MAGHIRIGLAAHLRKFLARVRSNPIEQKSNEGHFVEWVDDEDADSTIVGVWSTMKDEFVRPSHRAAEGQEQGDGVPFEIGGYKLRFPGDTSLGATREETEGCRCCIRYFAVNFDGQRLDLGIATPLCHAGHELKITPTSLVTLNGTTKAHILLGDGQTHAYIRQSTPNRIIVTSNRRQIARAETSDSEIISFDVDPQYAHQGIEDLIKRSVTHSFARKT